MQKTELRYGMANFVHFLRFFGHTYMRQFNMNQSINHLKQESSINHHNGLVICQVFIYKLFISDWFFDFVFVSYSCIVLPQAFGPSYKTNPIVLTEPSVVTLRVHKSSKRVVRHYSCLIWVLHSQYTLSSYHPYYDTQSSIMPQVWTEVTKS